MKTKSMKRIRSKKKSRSMTYSPVLLLLIFILLLVLFIIPSLHLNPTLDTFSSCVPRAIGTACPLFQKETEKARRRGSRYP